MQLIRLYVRKILYMSNKKNNLDLLYQEKYFKYKSKYNALKKMVGGDHCDNIKKELYIKYVDPNIPANFDVETINKIVLETIPNNDNVDHSKDVTSLNKCGATLTHIPEYYFSSR